MVSAVRETVWSIDTYCEASNIACCTWLGVKKSFFGIHLNTLFVAVNMGEAVTSHITWQLYSSKLILINRWILPDYVRGLIKLNIHEILRLYLRCGAVLFLRKQFCKSAMFQFLEG